MGATILEPAFQGTPTGVRCVATVVALAIGSVYLKNCPAISWYIPFQVQYVS
jgi:hypothetical protein